MNRELRPIFFTRSLLLSALLAGGAASAAAASDEGQLSFNSHCRTCHSVNEGDHRQGPSLHGIFGAEAGSSGYPNFSSSLSNSGVTWDEKTLDRFIANPEQLIPGNTMKPYSGISDKAERKKIVEYLKSEAG